MKVGLLIAIHVAQGVEEANEILCRSHFESSIGKLIDWRVSTVVASTTELGVRRAVQASPLHDTIHPVRELLVHWLQNCRPLGPCAELRAQNHCGATTAGQDNLVIRPSKCSFIATSVQNIASVGRNNERLWGLPCNVCHIVPAEAILRLPPMPPVSGAGIVDTKESTKEGHVCILTGLYNHDLDAADASSFQCRRRVQATAPLGAVI
mmetsp:Transcript_144711/g.360748  ORF Transcript_144711/g.360748 Transcript_144711/m.360748 type:complete len:208 (+) Transcript_144711:335-958(+)